MMGPLLLGLATGTLLAGLHLGGLAWTVRRLPVSGRPALLMLGSLAARLAISGAGLAILALAGPPALGGGLLGFAGGNLVLIRVLRGRVAPAPRAEED